MAKLLGSVNVWPAPRLNPSVPAILNAPEGKAGMLELRIVVLKLPAAIENGMVSVMGDVRLTEPDVPVSPLKLPSMVMRNGVSVVRPVPCIKKLKTSPEQAPAETQLTELLVISAVGPRN